jgi:hypothetical protein
MATPSSSSAAASDYMSLLLDSGEQETAELLASSDASYVNLLENPERFTGYSGPSAQRVWRAIQQENCFGEQGDVCLEKRVFYRYASPHTAAAAMCFHEFF